VLAIPSVYGLEAQARDVIVTPADQGDQAAYLAYAQQMRDTFLFH
jgi:hypothetical protein